MGEMSESKRNLIIVAQAGSIRSPIRSSILKPRCVKVRLMSKIEPKFRILWSLKNLGEGWQNVWVNF